MSHYDSEDDNGIMEESEDDEGFDPWMHENNQDEAFTPSYVVLTPKEIINDQVQAIDHIHSVFQTPRPTARQLLQHYKWDVEKLLEKYYERDTPDHIFRNAGIVDPSKSGMITKPEGTVECDICYENVMNSDIYGMGCNHYFCKDCWKQYLVGKIKDDGVVNNIECPASDCQILVDEFTITELLADELVVLEKYRLLVAKAFVAGNTHVRWCPAAGCDNAVKVEILGAKPVMCECGEVFCFQCGQQWHEPVACQMLSKWAKKCHDDSETAHWINANTKECPKCQVTIEKNGGCNHMICTSTSCKYEFCWVCMGEWAPHGSAWYNCARFDEKETKSVRENANESRVALERYLHYFNRYQNHESSLQMEGALAKTVASKIIQMQKYDMSWIEAQFLKKAKEILRDCRTTMKYTYVFAFYLEKTNQQVIFEDNQKNLEFVVEALSGLLERDMTTNQSPAEINMFKQEVLDKSSYCEKRRQVLLDHVAKGFEEGAWHFNESSH
eukprot:CFRG2290T1